MSLRHRCARCGASCQGLRVRPDPDERDALRAHAATLGIEAPFARGYLRHNWGTCVFYDDGCRLHAELGVDAKPRICRQFPFVYGTRGPDGERTTAIDPACFHATPAPASADAEDSEAAAPSRVPVLEGVPSTQDREDRWPDLSIGDRIRDRLRALPLVALLDGPHLGPLTTAMLEGLDTAVPRPPSPEEQALLDPRITTALQFALLPVSDPDTALNELIGGSQLLLGAGRPVGSGFAAWVRLLRTGVF